jgi:cytochrome bd-type quinol oxidase subunit 2
LLSVAMLVMHGGAWLVLKTSGEVSAPRARDTGSGAAVATIALYLRSAGILAVARSSTVTRITSANRRPRAPRIRCSRPLWREAGERVVRQLWRASLGLHDRARRSGSSVRLAAPCSALRSGSERRF